MEKSRSYAPLWLVVVVMLLATPRQLAAYIDPGSGSYLIQALMAGLLGGFFAVKTFWKQIRSYFSRGNSSSDD
jgi:hypothetical protein